MANKLNMTIAKTHQLSGRVIGMQLTAGTLIGIVFSAAQMSAGFFILAGGSNVLVGVGMVLLGVLLAVMIERLSLGGLAGVRVATEGLKRLEENFTQIVEPTEQEKSYYENRKKAFEKDI